MTEDNQPRVDDTLEGKSNKLFRDYVNTSYAAMKNISELYGAHVALSAVLMTSAQFAVQSHFAAGMDKDTILNLMAEVINDADSEETVASS